MSATFTLSHDIARGRAMRAVQSAPEGYVVRITAPRRSTDQNAHMWALLTEIATARPGGRVATPEQWKCLFMHSLGHQVRFETGLDGEPFPVGFRSSHLSKSQMRDLIECIHEYAARHGVRLRNAA